MNVPQSGLKHASGRAKVAGHLAALMFAVLIAGSFSLGDKAVMHIAPAALNAIRFIFGTALMAGVVLALTPAGQLPRPQKPQRFAILGLLFAAYFTLMFIALDLSDPVSMSAVFTLTPLMSAGFGRLFLGHSAKSLVWISLLIAGMGAIWVIFDGDVEAMARFDIGRGEVLFLVGCACHAAYTPLTNKFRRGETAPVFAFYTLVATTLFLVLAGAYQLAQTPILQLPPIVWIGVAYLAIFTTAGTTFLIQFAALRLPASKVMAYGYLTPGVVILIEGLSGHGWAPVSVAAGAVLTAVALLVMALGPDA